MLTKDQLEDIFSRTRILDPPDEVFQIEDAVILTPENMIALAATRPFGPKRIILTAASDRSSALHEMIHQKGILNESLTARLTNVILRINKRMRPIRKVTFKQCTVGHDGCISEQKAFQDMGIAQIIGPDGVPLKITHFVRLDT